MENIRMKEHLHKLRNEMIFSLFDDEDLENISSYFDLVKYPAEAVIFNEGDDGDFLGFVVAGKLEVKKQTEFKGNQVIIALLSSGALVGELSIFDQHKRSATVEAVEDTLMLVLKNKAVELLIQKHPYTGIKLMKGLIRILSLRLRKATERLTTIF